MKQKCYCRLQNVIFLSNFTFSWSWTNVGDQGKGKTSWIVFYASNICPQSLIFLQTWIINQREPNGAHQFNFWLLLLIKSRKLVYEESWLSRFFSSTNYDTTPVRIFLRTLMICFDDSFPWGHLKRWCSARGWSAGMTIVSIHFKKHTWGTHDRISQAWLALYICMHALWISYRLSQTLFYVLNFFYLTQSNTIGNLIHSKHE